MTIPYLYLNSLERSGTWDNTPGPGYSVWRRILNILGPSKYYDDIIEYYDLWHSNHLLGRVSDKEIFVKTHSHVGIKGNK